MNSNRNCIISVASIERIRRTVLALAASAAVLVAAHPVQSHEDIIYQVRKGDTLWELSQRYLGDGANYDQIFENNAHSISDPDLILEGQKLIVPGVHTDAGNLEISNVQAADATSLYDIEEGLRDSLEVGFEQSDALKIALDLIEVPTRIQVVSLEQAQREKLELSLAAARVLGSTEAWHSGVFISNDIISQVVSSLENIKLDYDGTDVNLRGATIEIASAELASQVGSLFANLGIRATRGELSVGLTLNAAIEFDRFDNSADGNRNAVFKLTPVEIIPELVFEGVSVRQKALWVNVSPVVQELFGAANSFELPVPIPSMHSIELAIDRETTDVFDEEKDRSITYTTKMAERSIEIVSTAAAPVFTSRGLYLASGPKSFNEIEAAVSTISTEEIPITDLSTELEGRVASWQFQESDIEVFVGANFLETSIEELGAGPTASRVINVQSTRVTGNLAEDRWRDKFLGDGGVWAAFANDNAVRASISWAKVDASFSDNGIDLSAALSFQGKADVKFHFDPLIGGGIGTSIGMDTNSNANVRLRVTPDFVQDGDLKFGYLTVASECQLIRADIRSDGKFKVSKSWATVPSVGARLGIPIGKEPLFEDVVLINQSEVVDLGVDPFKVEDWKPDGRVFGAIISVTPSRLYATSDGIRAGAELSFSPFEPGTTPSDVEQKKHVARKQKEDAQIRAQDWISRNEFKPTCDLDSEIALLLGPVEIGKNNELVKLVTNAINDAWDGPGKNNEVTKLLREAGVDVEDVGIKDIYQKAEQRFNKAKDRLGKPLEKPGKTAKCVLTLGNSC